MVCSIYSIARADGSSLPRSSSETDVDKKCISSCSMHSLHHAFHFHSAPGVLHSPSTRLVRPQNPSCRIQKSCNVMTLIDTQHFDEGKELFHIVVAVLKQRQCPHSSLTDVSKSKHQQVRPLRKLEGCREVSRDPSCLL
jgi:hypothetical protein